MGGEKGKDRSCKLARWGEVLPRLSTSVKSCVPVVPGQHAIVEGQHPILTPPTTHANSRAKTLLIPPTLDHTPG
jgi:hypothetical protein